MDSSIWVFGYGSLVSPTSMARTIGRVPDPATDLAIANLDGFGRRWNYGSHVRRGKWRDGDTEVTDGLVVALGLEANSSESCNGVVIRVTNEELAELDIRERDYERTDVTELMRLESPLSFGQVVTYVPRPSAVSRYEQARDEGRAAIERRYWDLVHSAFDELGAEHHESFSTTPAPDVPVADISFG